MIINLNKYKKSKGIKPPKDRKYWTVEDYEIFVTQRAREWVEKNPW